MNNFTKPLSDAIRQARNKLGLTQEQVAELAGTDPMNIIKMENINRNARACYSISHRSRIEY